MPPKHTVDQTDETDREEQLSHDSQEATMEPNPTAECARKLAEEKRSDRRRQHFIEQFVAPLCESEKCSGSQNARTFAARWDASAATAAIALKQRAEIFITLLREYEAMRMRDELADAEIEMTDWLAAKQHFGTALAPATNTIVRDAATILNMRQQPAEDVSKYAVGWRGSLLPLPPADRKEADN